MKRSSLAFLCALLFAIIATAQEDTAKPLHDLLQATKLPEGYEATTTELKNGEKHLGTMIVIIKPEQVSKVVVRIEARDLTAIPIRRAASKAYVNATITALAESGFKLVENNFPDLTKETFGNPLSIDLVFADKEGKKLWAHQEIFFTDKGFNVQVIADDPKSLASLTTWAKTVKPKAAPK